MTFDEYIGLEYPGPDFAGEGMTAEIDIQAHHCNPTGNINGGVLISLADNIATGAAGRAYQTKFGEERFMVGVDLHAVMLSNQQGGRIRGQALPVRVGRRITVVRTVVLGEGDKKLAEITTTHVPA